jgi:hypothetical protein
MPSRAAAVRELLRHGLESAGAVVENAGIKSGDYGVLKAPKWIGNARDSLAVKVAKGGLHRAIWLSSSFAGRLPYGLCHKGCGYCSAKLRF